MNYGPCSYLNLCLTVVCVLVLGRDDQGGTVFAEQPAPRPNIVHIFADDLGHGAVGYTGNQLNLAETPNLDAMAAGGMILRNAYAAATCTPSRSMLFTGFHNGHTLADRNEDNDEIGGTFRDEDVTVAEVLKSAGYNTALFGKHAFGGTEGGGRFNSGVAVDDPPALPNNMGYDDFYGYLDQTRAHNYFVDELWESDSNSPHGVRTVSTGNNEQTPHAAYSHDLIADRSLKAIETYASQPQPFYLQLNYTIPHDEIDHIDDAPAVTSPRQTQPSGLGIYVDHPTMTLSEKRYAAMVTRMDASVGHVLDKLRDPNGDGDRSDSVMENTLVIFTSDNGSTTSDGTPHKSFDLAAPFRGGKRDLFEGGIHVPGVAYWEGTIAPGSESNRVTDVADFLPTAAELAGVAAPVGIDGVSIAATLTGQGVQRDRDYLIFEHHKRGGPDPDVRDPRWAVIRRDGMKLIEFSGGSQLLFDLTTDSHETNPLDLEDPSNLAIRDELQAIAVADGVEQADGYAVQYRTWTGGNGDNVASPENWSAEGGPDERWIALLANSSDSHATADVTSSLTTLGFEIRGNGISARQLVSVQADQMLTGRNEVRVSANGQLYLEQGTVASERWVEILVGAKLTGTGTIAAELFNHGEIAPGAVDESTAGVLHVNDDLTLAQNGTLVIGLGGSDDPKLFDRQYDAITSDGKAKLDGTLRVTLDKAFVPGFGDHFTIVEAETISGTFETMDLPPLPNGNRWHVDYASRAVALRVVPEPNGLVFGFIILAALLRRRHGG